MTSIARRALGRIAAYAPDRSPCRVDLSDNTNAWGMPPAAVQALATAVNGARYPSPYAADLKAAVSSYLGVPSECVTTGCGSDDVLDSAIRAFGEPGETLVYTAPTFGMVPVFAQLNGLSAVDLPFDRLAGAGRVVYVCAPNNPTGEVMSRYQIETLLDSCTSRQVVIVDEAYAEFAGTSVVDLIDRYDRLLVTRTMSKAFGLAGLRVGYAVGSAVLIAEVEKSRGPFKVSSQSERAAVAALTTGRQWMRDHVAIACEMRDRLVLALRQRGLEPLGSAANFVFVPLDDATTIARGMRQSGVAVRAFDAPSGLRITVAPWDLLSEALEALDQARASCA